MNCRIASCFFVQLDLLESKVMFCASLKGTSLDVLCQLSLLLVGDCDLASIPKLRSISSPHTLESAGSPKCIKGPGML